MAGTSGMLKYPPELLSYIDSLIDDPRITQANILTTVNPLIKDKYPDEKLLSSGVLGRRAKERREGFEEQAQILAEKKALRDQFFENYGHDGLDNAGRFHSEMLYSQIGDLQMSVVALKNYSKNREGDNEVEPISLAELDTHSKIIARTSTAIGNLEKSLSESRNRNEAIKSQAREEAQLEAAETMKKVAATKGVSDDISAAIYKAMTQDLST